MRWNKILITIKKELRAIVRDKKSFTTILVMPIIIPIFIFLMSFLFDFMLSNEDAINVVGSNYELNANEQSIASELNLELEKYQSKEDLEKAYENGDILAYIYLEDDKYEIYSNPNDMDSSMAAQSIVQYLDAYNKFLAENYLMSEDIDTDEVFNIITYDLHELEGDNYFVQQLANMAFPYIMTIIAMTASVCATDSTAGEKEHGTLETLLTFPIKSSEIITGKYLAITIIGIISGLFSLVLALVSLKLSLNLFDLFEGMTINMSIFRIIAAITLIISSSLIFAGVSIAIASHSKTFKEAQSSLQLLIFISLVPMFLPMFKVKTNILLSIIPIIGQGMLLNDLFSSAISSINVIAMFTSSVIFIIALIWYISKQYKSEKVLFF